MNGLVTKAVGRKTVESLVKPEVRAALTPQPYYFCDAADCDTVYVSALGDHLIAKDMRWESRRPKTRSHSATASDMTVRQCVMISGSMLTPGFRKSSGNALRPGNAAAKRPTRAVVAVWEQ